MLAGILFLTLIVVVGVLITVDVAKTTTEASTGPSDRHVHDAERSGTAARSGAGAHAFAREPAVREKPVPVAALGARADADPFEAGSFERPDQATRGFDQMRRDGPSAGSDAQRGKFNAMFVNLSRRSQALVERQLRLIESLEHGEQDQHRLASLSRLNRLAIRIHRNSQNLLVLAGQEPATGWNQPVTLAHLVEAAVAEIEEYERVSFEVQPDIAVRGPAVNDAVHLLVELIDNATAFSAADMPVYVKGQVLTSGGALIDITDRGIGMAAKEMAYANQQLDNPPPPDIDIPKWMGLLVVARLAARHGIRVRLNQAESGGLTALVWLPDEILTHYGAGADPGRAAAGQRAAVASSGAFAAARMTTTPDARAARPDPGLVGPELAGHGPRRADRGGPRRRWTARRAERGRRRGPAPGGGPDPCASAAHLRRGRVALVPGQPRGTRPGHHLQPGHRTRPGHHLQPGDRQPDCGRPAQASAGCDPGSAAHRPGSASGRVKPGPALPAATAGPDSSAAPPKTGPSPPKRQIPAPLTRPDPSRPSRAPAA